MKNGKIFWFTGLSGAGKTTLALAAKAELERRGFSVLILDGDDVRERLNKTLGFSEEDIKENNRLISELCLKERASVDIILVPVISPFAISRRQARAVLGEGFYEIYFSAGLDTVVNRDPKGLYAKAKANVITNMIGYSPGSVYEPPENPDYEIDTSRGTVEEQAHEFVAYIAGQFDSARLSR